jgi:hypothetical protein
VSATDTDDRLGPTDDGKTRVKLAHPLPKRDLIRFGIDKDTTQVGDVLTVTLDQAISLIGAGMVQVDPEDHVGVTALLRGEKAALDVMPTATSGNTEPVNYNELKGDALDKALEQRGLPNDGTAAEKRLAVASYDQRNA